MAESLKAQALEFEKAIAELELAMAHLRHVVNHFRSSDVPRAAAHEVAVRGHMLKAQRTLDDWAILHTTKVSV